MSSPGWTRTSNPPVIGRGYSGSEVKVSSPRASSHEPHEPLSSENSRNSGELCMDHRWSGWTGAYVETLRASGRSPLTIRLHKHYLSTLARSVPHLSDVSEDVLIAVLAQPTWGSEARKSARTVYRGFFGWASRRGLIQGNPAADLPT